jgi:NAD(P)-dependent dehydrogenase (short-subunit alcohol dehydrogenase family)
MATGDDPVGITGLAAGWPRSMTTMAEGTGAAARRVAWVTGASRGVGRESRLPWELPGWAVYVTARSSAAGRTGHLPGTVEEAAAAVTAAGGQGAGIVCDHADDAAVAAVARRIGAERGRLDLLVNNVWGGYERVNAGLWEESRAPLCGIDVSS